MPRPRIWHSLLAGCLATSLLLLSGCATDEPDGLSSGSLVRLEVDNADPERIIRYYLGGYLGPEGGDPFETGLAVSLGGRIYLNLDSLNAAFPPAADALQDVNQNDRIDWEELESFLQETYYDARGIPEDITEFRQAHDYKGNPDSWFQVEVNGVMTTARRRVLVPVDALRHAISNYRQNQDRLLYPVGTAIVGEHYLDGTLEETTAMIKRGDGFWDFVTYGGSGSLAASTATPPRPLKSPTQCVGCHFGSKRFEPEASYPAEARPGPHGPRVLHVGDELRNSDVTALFQEHDRRSDTILGLYATLFVARLEAQRRAGAIAPEDEALLASVGL